MATHTSHSSISTAFAAIAPGWMKPAPFDSDAKSPEICDSSLSHYMKTIAQFRLLTPDEEIRIGTEIQNAQRALRLHLRRSGFVIRLAAELALVPTNQKRIGCRGNSKKETVAHVSELRNAIGVCQEAYNQQDACFDAAFCRLDALCETFPLKPRVYSDLIEVLESELNRIETKDILANTPDGGKDKEAFCLANWMPFADAQKHLEEARRLENRWIKAREIMVNANLRLVVHEAKLHQNRGLSLEDLIQSGNETLLKAADSFDPVRGCRFSTHATTHLRGELRRALDDDGRLVRIPVHVCEKIRKLEGKTKELTRELGGKPSFNRLGKETGMSVRDIEELMVIKQCPLSLHHPVGDESDKTLESLLADKLAWVSEEEDHLQEVRQKVEALFGILTETEREVIRLSFGLEYGLLSDDAEVAARLGLKQSNVSQIKARAMGALRKAANHLKAA